MVKEDVRCTLLEKSQPEIEEVCQVHSSSDHLLLVVHRDSGALIWDIRYGLLLASLRLLVYLPLSSLNHVDLI